MLRGKNHLEGNQLLLKEKSLGCGGGTGQKRQKERAPFSSKKKGEKNQKGE